MRAEFENLVETLERWDLFQSDDEVGMALNSLKDKIDEVEKRIKCALRSSQEANDSISLYTQRVDNNETFKMEVNDHDSILRGTNDVLIALDMKDTECIDNNWYELFKPYKELTPIAVGNIEYDFPEDVYTIGNADNTEIIGDVYESSFHELLDLGIILCEGDDKFPNGSMANYVVRNNEFIPMVKIKQIDLSKVPIKKEVFMTFESSWGYISCDEDGNILEINGDEYINGERNYLYDIGKIDIAEYIEFLNSRGLEIQWRCDDILCVGFWNKDNAYNPADEDWRKGDEVEEKAPTMQCMESDNFDKVKQVIEILKSLDNGNGVDGETMEYILRKVGMEEQMLKQLVAQTTNDEIGYLLDVRNGTG